MDVKEKCIAARESVNCVPDFITFIPTAVRTEALSPLAVTSTETLVD